MKKLGFIGMGNMAQALVRGFLASGQIAAADVYAYAPHQEKLRENAAQIGFHPCADPEELADAADTLIMACKPYQIEDVLRRLGARLNGKALISVAAGWGYARYREHLDDSVRVQFVMPNTPAMAGEGVMLFETSHSLLPAEREEIMQLFGSVGIVEEMPDHLMEIGSAVTGCGPAFVDLMMEAYADAAVKYGIPRQTAYRLVSQTVLGAAKLQAQTGEHPGILKDNVCSPGGSTIRGVAQLEKCGFRDACISSIDAIMSWKGAAPGTPASPSST